MPERPDHNLKDKVHKLERLLRAREERIVALETENAMLYLKLAECQGSVRTSRYECSHFRRLFEAEEGFKKNSKESIKNLHKEAQQLKKQLHGLKTAVMKMPEEFSKYVECAQTKTTQYGSEGMTSIEKMQSKLVETEMQLDVALQRAAAEKDRRKTLHNALVEIRGNIRVHCRMRPLIGVIDAHGDGSIGKAGTPSEQVVHAIDEETMSVMPNRPQGSGGAVQKKVFEFERVYNGDADQRTVFADVAPLLTSLLDGYNVCIMAYGQTGSGKTHTMLGSHDIDVDIDSEQLNKDEGIIPRAAKELFRLMTERETATESYSLEMSVCEIYNNDVRDLLAPSNKVEKLNIITSSEGDTEIPSLVTKPVTNVQELMNLVYYGMCRRHEDATMVHAHSSRSHLIVQLQLYTITNQQTARVATPSSEAAPSPPGTPTQPRRTLPQPIKGHGSRSQSPAPPRGRSMKRSKSPAPGSAAARSRSPSPARSSTSTPPITTTVKTKLQLVDLAGSESVGMSGVTGAALRETSFINKSLSALADVLGALAEHRSHIPYRNTRLTHMLQDTIGGNAKLLVMLCVSPAQRFITETYQCIGFGSRARQVARGPAKKRRPTSFTPNSPLSLDLSQVNTALRSNGNLSPRFNPNRRRGSNFAFPD